MACAARGLLVLQDFAKSYRLYVVCFMLHVTCRMLLQALQSLNGDLFDLTISDMVELSRMFDVHGEGAIDIATLRAYIRKVDDPPEPPPSQRVRRESTVMLEKWNQVRGDSEATRQAYFNKDATKLAKRIPKTRKSTWQLLYCGGAAPVAQSLAEVCNDLKINFHQESFKW